MIAEEEEELEEGQLARPPAEDVGDAPAEAEAGEGDSDDEEDQSVAAREDAHRDDGEAPPTPFSVPSGWKVVDEKPGNVLPRTLIPDGVGVRVMWNWPASGWSVGQVACRYNGKFKDEANYTVWYSDTQTKGFHMFAVGTHVLAADAPTAPAGAWVIVQPPGGYDSDADDAA